MMRLSRRSQLSPFRGLRASQRARGQTAKRSERVHWASARDYARSYSISEAPHRARPSAQDPSPPSRGQAPYLPNHSHRHPPSRHHRHAPLPVWPLISSSHPRTNPRGGYASRVQSLDPRGGCASRVKASTRGADALRRRHLNATQPTPTKRIAVFSRPPRCRRGDQTVGPVPRPLRVIPGGGRSDRSEERPAGLVRRTYVHGSPPDDASGRTDTRTSPTGVPAGRLDPSRRARGGTDRRSHLPAHGPLVRGAPDDFSSRDARGTPLDHPARPMPVGPAGRAAQTVCRKGPGHALPKPHGHRPPPPYVRRVNGPERGGDAVMTGVWGRGISSRETTIVMLLADWYSGRSNN